MNTEHPELPGEGSKLILYTTDDGKARVSLMSRDGRVWLNQKQMAELFAVTKMNISLHIANILKEKELDDSVVKFSLQLPPTASDITLPFWIDAVDKMLAANLLEVLHGPGLVSHEEAVEVSSERYESFDCLRKREDARLADEADLEELKRIEDEAKKRHGK